MKIFFLSVLICTGLLFPSYALASHVELRPCIEVAHCVREEWDVTDIENPYENIKTIIANSPRTKIVELDGDYLHAEATTKWMKYVDDLEVTYLPASNKLLIRSESRVGESDLGVNKKRVDLIKSKLF